MNVYEINQNIFHVILDNHHMYLINLNMKKHYLYLNDFLIIQLNIVV